MSTSEIGLTTRNATLEDLIGLLQHQHAAKLDVVLPAAALTSVGGDLHLAGVGQPLLTADGVTPASTVLRPTAVADAGIADKLGIPIGYLRRLREHHVGLFDANVNTWLGDDPTRRFLIRGLTNPTDTNPAAEPGWGVCRALLSHSYRFVDHLDVLMAVLDGIRRTGTEVTIASCDLTERRLYVKLHAPAVAEYAPDLLADYTSPFTGARGADNPLVFAGLVLSNSETGHGSFSITPQLTVEVCTNGMTLTRHAMREVHLGGQLRDGVIAWSADTQAAQLELIGNQARDAVATFLDRGFLRAQLAEITRDAGVQIRDPQATLEHVGKTLRYSTEQQATILSHFIRGSDLSSGGVLHAVTSAAQTVPDADDAYDLERSGLRAMSVAAAHAGGAGAGALTAA